MMIALIMIALRVLPLSDDAKQKYAYSHHVYEISSTLIGTRVLSENYNGGAVLLWDTGTGVASGFVIPYSETISLSRDEEVAQQIAEEQHLMHPRAVGLTLHNGVVSEVRNYPYFDQGRYRGGS